MMRYLRSGIFLIFGLLNQGAGAHVTAVGFEETLTSKNRMRLEKFMAEQKQAGYTKCYYSAFAGTIVCEAPNTAQVYFR